MLKRMSILICLTALAVPLSAQAQGWYEEPPPYEYGWHEGYGNGWDNGWGNGWDNGQEAGRRGGYHDGYERGQHDGYRQARQDDGESRRRYYHRGCRGNDGTGGLIVGGLAGGLLGHEIARDRTVGTLLGGGLGAIAGRAIDRNGQHC